VKIRDEGVWIKMTLTSPGCPYAPALLEAVKESCKDAGAKSSEIEITFDPPWEPPEEVKWAIGGFSPWSA
jgi:metal-sulfur cluster biosynthetic enzyme